jgi:hypothetical protein
MLHACVERFDVMGGRENILSWDGEVNKAYVGHHRLRLEQLGARWPDELQIRCLGLLEA